MDIQKMWDDLKEANNILIEVLENQKRQQDRLDGLSEKFKEALKFKEKTIEKMLKVIKRRDKEIYRLNRIIKDLKEVNK